VVIGTKDQGDPTDTQIEQQGAGGRAPSQRRRTMTELAWTRCRGLTPPLLLTTFAACGAPDANLPPAPLDSSLPVIVTPRSTVFSEPIRVSLRDTQGSRIYYTLDGMMPTDTSAVPYEGPIELKSTTLLQFVARLPDGRWSPAGRELYTYDPGLPVIAEPEHRGRLRPGDILFFAWKAGDSVPMTETVEVASVGKRPLVVRRLELLPNPAGAFFFDPEAFEVPAIDEPVILAPGTSLSFEISYRPTATLRSAVLRVVCDSDDGPLDLEMWGRISPW
jgi:hypothetical protein